MGEPARISARELSRDASRVLDRVERGERLTVTRDGEPIAEIIPIDPAQRVMARLIRDGLIAPPPPGGYATGGDLAAVAQRLVASGEVDPDSTATAKLLEMREHER
jgi:prevent-host-death family protein